MIRTVFVFVALCGLAAPAAAQMSTAVVDAAVAAVAARAEPDQRWAFTRTVTNAEASFTAAYDPNLPAGQAWRLVSPESVDLLTDDLKRMFEGLIEEQEPDRAVVLGDSEADEGALEALFGSELTLLRQSAVSAVFSFRPQPGADLGGGRNGGGVNESMARHLAGELIVDVAEPMIDSFRIFAEQAFKPSPMARLTALDVEMALGETTPDGPIAIVQTRTHIAGDALFQAFDETIVVANSDFMRSDAAPQAAE
jgi:hypothetical protein